MVSAAICRTIHQILPDMALINLCKKLDTGVSYSNRAEVLLMLPGSK